MSHRVLFPLHCNNPSAPARAQRSFSHIYSLRIYYWTRRFLRISAGCYYGNDITSYIYFHLTVYNKRSVLDSDQRICFPSHMFKKKIASPVDPDESLADRQRLRDHVCRRGRIALVSHVLEKWRTRHTEVHTEGSSKSSKKEKKWTNK